MSEVEATAIGTIKQPNQARTPMDEVSVTAAVEVMMAVYRQARPGSYISHVVAREMLQAALPHLNSTEGMPTWDAFLRATRACNWRNEQIRQMGGQAIALSDTDPHYPPEDTDWKALLDLTSAEQSTRAEMEREIAELREALAPFAHIACYFEYYIPEAMPVLRFPVRPSEAGDLDGFPQTDLTVSDFAKAKRALTALAKAQPGEG
ncbi:MAG: hypothetical protein AAF687_13885 [Pseudomonadota bacterium]